MSGMKDDAPIDEKTVLGALDYMIKTVEKKEKLRVDIIILPSKPVRKTEELDKRLEEMSKTKVILSSRGIWIFYLWKNII